MITDFKLAWLSIVTLSIFTMIFFHNCGHAPVKHQNFPPIGKTIVPTSIQSTAQFKTYNDYKHVLIHFSAGNSALAYN